MLVKYIKVKIYVSKIYKTLEKIIRSALLDT